MRILETENLSKIYGGSQEGVKVEALKDINIAIDKGEFVGIMGPSGSGKTTLLNILATMDSPTSGRVILDGKSPHTMSQDQLAVFRREKLGFIFQEFNLLDSLTVEENISLPLVLGGRKEGEIKKRVEEVSRLLNIESILDKRTYEISGGQQQRTAAARAILGEPELILADEPTGNLDSKASFDLMSSLERLNQDKDATIVMVTHDAFAASFCKRIIMIKDGEEFLELRKKGTRQVFFKEILDALSLLGGGYNENI